jgi:hypothetical protein
VIVNPNAVPADAQAKLRRFDVRKPFELPSSVCMKRTSPRSIGVAVCDIGGAHIELGLIGRSNPIGHRLPIHAILFRRSSVRPFSGNPPG